MSRLAVVFACSLCFAALVLILADDCEDNSFWCTITEKCTQLKYIESKCQCSNSQNDKYCPTNQTCWSRVSWTEAACVSYASVNISSAWFDNSLERLYVNFSGSAKRTDQNNDDCSIFTPETVSKLGSNPTCVFQLSRPNSLKIQLGAAFSLRPGNNLVLADGKINSTYSGTPVVGMVTVLAPAGTPVPQITIEGPRTVGSCSESYLEAASPGKDLQFLWNVSLSKTSNAATSQVTSDIENIRNRLLSLGKSLTYLTIPRSEIVQGFTYNFTIMVRNILGYSSLRSFEVERKPNDFPTLSLGRTERTILVSRDLTLYGMVTLSPCQATQSLSVTYRWDINKNKNVLNDKTLNSSRLYIPARQLTPEQTYVFTLVVSSSGNADVQGTVTIRVRRSPLQVAVKGGGRVVSSTRPLKLAAAYYDPDNTADQDSFAWACEGCPAGVTLPPQYSIEVNVSSFAAGIEYKFTVTFTKGSRSVSASAVVEVTAAVLAQVYVTAPLQNEVNPAEKLFLDATIITTQNATYGWTLGQASAFIDLATQGATAVPTSGTVQLGAGESQFSTPLVINAGRLRGGRTYVFQLRVTTTRGTSSSQVQIITNSAPTIGVFQTDKSQGTEGVTNFTLIAREGWSDEAGDLPLLFRFGYQTKAADGSVLRILLNTFTEQDMVTGILLPAGDNEAENKLVIFVEVKDKHGAMVSNTTTITVTPIGSESSAAVLSRMKKSVDDSCNALDLVECINSVRGLATSTINQASKSTVALDVVTALNGIVSQVETREEKSLILQTYHVVLYAIKVTLPTGTKETIAKYLKEQVVDKNEANRAFKFMVEPSSGRRKRSVDTQSVSSAGGKTAQEVEIILTTFENITSPTAYDAGNKKIKQDFLQSADSLAVAMCKGLGLGEKPAVAKSKLAVVKSYKNDFRDIDTKKLNIASNESTDILSKSSARVLLGSELRTKFRTWNCTGSKATDDMCHGACITSMQLPHDLLSPAALNTRISDVVYIVLNNPKTYDYMNVHNLNQPVMFEVPLYTNPDSGIFECRMWTRSSNSWTPSSCSTKDATLTGEGGVKFAQCTCSSLGYLTVIRRDTDDTGGGSNGASTKGYVSVEFDRDCKDIVDTDKETTFLNDVRKGIAAKLSLNESEITDMDASCGSIIVNFTIVLSNRTALNASLDKLGQLTRSADLVLQLTDGSVIKGVKTFMGLSLTSMDGHVAMVKPTPKPTRSIQPINTDLKPMFMAIAICLAVVVFCVCYSCCLHTWYLYKKKYTKINSDSLDKLEQKRREAEKAEKLRLAQDDVELLVRNAVPGAADSATATNSEQKFDMTHTKRQKVDERQLTKYECFQTSYLPGMLDQPGHASVVEPAPKLMCDESDSSDSDSELGNENQGYIPEIPVYENDRPNSSSAQSIINDSVIYENMDDLTEQMTETATEAPPLPPRPATSLSRPPSAPFIQVAEIVKDSSSPLPPTGIQTPPPTPGMFSPLPPPGTNTSQPPRSAASSLPSVETPIPAPGTPNSIPRPVTPAEIRPNTTGSRSRPVTPTELRPNTSGSRSRPVTPTELRPNTSGRKSRLVTPTELRPNTSGSRSRPVTPAELRPDTSGSKSRPGTTTQPTCRNPSLPLPLTGIDTPPPTPGMFSPPPTAGINTPQPPRSAVSSLPGVETPIPVSVTPHSISRPVTPAEPRPETSSSRSRPVTPTEPHPETSSSRSRPVTPAEPRPDTSNRRSRPGTSSQPRPDTSGSKSRSRPVTPAEPRPATSSSRSRPVTPAEPRPDTSGSRSRPGTSTQPRHDTSRPSTAARETRPGSPDRKSRPGTANQPSRPASVHDTSHPATAVSYPDEDTV